MYDLPFDGLVIFAVFAAALVPLSFVSMRESVKKQRREVVRDLQAVFDKSGAEIIPSFEFVKYKYFFDRGSKETLDSVTPKDYRQYYWILGSVPLILITSLINFYVFGLILIYGLHFRFSETWLWGYSKDTMPLIALIILAAYAGASLFMLKAFFRAIHNFDLSPLSFIGAWVNLLLGIGAALVFTLGFMRLSRDLLVWNEASPGLQALMLLTSFFVGRLPDLANRNMLRAVQLRNYKQENITVYKSFTAVPVEIIDGVDSEIRDRLADFHINAVQNLAAANPLLLYVETPYGVYQIMDWVAQATLCCSVGPAALLQLWALGVRTIFDLERAVLDQECYDHDIVMSIGTILLGTLKDKQGQTVQASEAAVKADVRVRLDNPHVQRLRQLFMRVADRIGKDSRSLPPLPKRQGTNAIARYLDALHELGGLKNTDIATFTDVPPATVQRWKAGSHFPHPKTQLLLADLYYVVSRLDGYHSAEEVRLWLYAPHPQLEGERAIDRIVGERTADVIAILDRMGADVYM